MNTAEKKLELERLIAAAVHGVGVEKLTGNLTFREGTCEIVNESDPWTKVEDGLPSGLNDVLVLTKSKVKYLAYLHYGEWFATFDAERLNKTITHWCDIPTPKDHQ